MCILCTPPPPYPEKAVEVKFQIVPIFISLSNKAINIALQCIALCPLSNKAINIALQCIALCPLENKALPRTLRHFSHFHLLTSF